MLNKVLSFAVLSSVLFSFASCKDDDDKDDSNNQETINVDYTISGTLGDYSYVDLGLKSGTLWATYNVGASNSTEAGYCVRWGEIEENSEGKASYKWRDKSYTDKIFYTKYVLDSEFGTVDSLSTLESADDIATVAWGSDWRMPTATELQELIDGCDWTWMNYLGSDSGGFRGVSKTNGNKIFLPAAFGSIFHEILGDHGAMVYDVDYREGCYWSSSLDENKSNSAFSYCFFPSDYCESWGRGDIYRYSGGSVRAVRK